MDDAAFNQLTSEQQIAFCVRKNCLDRLSQLQLLQYAINNGHVPNDKELKLLASVKPESKTKKK